MVMMVARKPVAQVAEVASSGGRSKVTCRLCVKALMPTIVGSAFDMMIIVAAMAGSGQQQQSHLRFMNKTLSCTLQLQQLHGKLQQPARHLHVMDSMHVMDLLCK